MSQITRTNRVGQIKGEWIDENSAEFNQMGIRESSFINLENILTVPASLIKYGPIGSYPNIEKLLAIHGMVSTEKPSLP